MEEEHLKHLKTIRRLRKSNERHDKLQRIISNWFKKQGYKVLWEWYSIDVVAYKLEEDDVKELIGVEVKTWKKFPEQQIKKAIFQAKTNKRYVDKFYIAFKKSERVWKIDIPEWIGIISVESKPLVLREAKYQRTGLPFYAVNWWKEKFLLKKFGIQKAYKLTTRQQMEEKLKSVVDKDTLTKALRIQMLKQTPSLEDIKGQVSKSSLSDGQKTLIKYWS